jgi:hypothetical protein
MIAFCLAFILAAPQEADPTAYKLDQLTISTYEPRNVDVDSIYNLVSNLMVRNLLVEDRYVSNLNYVYDRILIYDTPDYTKRILAMMKQIDDSFQGTDTARELEQSQTTPKLADFPVQEYRVRSLNIAAAFELLNPYYRSVSATDSAGNYVDFTNLSRVIDNVLLIRDTAENTAAMLKLLEKFDRPAQQVQISVWVLRGESFDGSTAPPAELSKSLQQLIPEVSFSLDARGMLRTSIGPDLDLRLALSGATGDEFDLSLQTGPYDEQSGSLSLSQCTLIRTDSLGNTSQLFQTTTAVRAGEYAVIGVTGSEPVLLALRLQVLQ